MAVKPKKKPSNLQTLSQSGIVHELFYDTGVLMTPTNQLNAFKAKKKCSYQ
jgi:hypothetical protein